MPEYHQIQVTVPYDEARFGETMARYVGALREIGCISPAVEAWAAGVRWEPSDGGFVYGGGMEHWLAFELAGGRFRAAPTVMGWNPETYPASARSWVQLDLIFESAEIEDASEFPERLRFHPHLAAGLWSAVAAFARAFPEAGVFLTNEATDGEPWEGTIEKDARKIWSFDLAVVQASQAAIYARVPDTHWSRADADFLAFADRRSWTQPPWEAA